MQIAKSQHWFLRMQRYDQVAASFTINPDYSVKNIYNENASLTRKKLLAKNAERRFQKTIWFDKRRDV